MLCRARQEEGLLGPGRGVSGCLGLSGKTSESSLYRGVRESIGVYVLASSRKRVMNIVTEYLKLQASFVCLRFPLLCCLALL